MSIPNATTTRPQAPPIPPHIAVPLIRDRAERLYDAVPVNEFASTDHLLAVLGMVTDLVDVITQLTAPAGPSVEYALLVDHEDGEAAEYVPAVDASHAEQMARTVYRGRPTWTVGREPEGAWRYVRRGTDTLTAAVTA